MSHINQLKMALTINSLIAIGLGLYMVINGCV